jgi:hypothetical protein
VPESRQHGGIDPPVEHERRQRQAGGDRPPQRLHQRPRTRHAQLMVVTFTIAIVLSIELSTGFGNEADSP